MIRPFCAYGCDGDVVEIQSFKLEKIGDKNGISLVIMCRSCGKEDWPLMYCSDLLQAIHLLWAIQSGRSSVIDHEREDRNTFNPLRLV